MGKLLIIKDADFSGVKVDKVTPIRGQVNITVVASPTRGGIVSGSGRYAEGDAIEISAVANEDFTFTKWSDDVLTPTRNIIVGDSDAVYTALFDEAAMRTKYIILGNASSVGTWSTALGQTCFVHVYEGDIITVVPPTTGSYKKANIEFVHNSPDSLGNGTPVNFANNTNGRIQETTTQNYVVTEDCYFGYLIMEGWIPDSLTINGVEYIEQSQE